MSSQYLFRNNRLWANFEIAGRSALGLIDTGTSITIVPRRWMVGENISRYQEVSTPFNIMKLPVVKSKHFAFGGSEYENIDLLVSKTRFPIIGNNILFKRDHLFMSQNGICFENFNVHRDPIAHSKIETEFRHYRNEKSVRSIHFHLEVDGHLQKAFFDTGRENFLTGTSNLPASPSSSNKRYDIRYNPMGNWGLKSFRNRKSLIRLDNLEFEMEYRHYEHEKSVEAPVIIGSKILSMFDIHISVRDGHALFYPRGTFEFGRN